MSQIEKLDSYEEYVDADLMNKIIDGHNDHDTRIEADRVRRMISNSVEKTLLNRVATLEGKVESIIIVMAPEIRPKVVTNQIDDINTAEHASRIVDDGCRPLPKDPYWSGGNVVPPPTTKSIRTADDIESLLADQPETETHAGFVNGYSAGGLAEPGADLTDYSPEEQESILRGLKQPGDIDLGLFGEYATENNVDTVTGKAEPKPAEPEGLKPCPFCGGEGESVEEDITGGNAWSYQVYCNDCEVSRTAHYGTMVEAITAWNRRADSASPVIPVDPTAKGMGHLVYTKEMNTEHEAEGMEKYIGKPCLFGYDSRDGCIVTDTLGEIGTEGYDYLYITEDGDSYPMCKPHPISEELIQARAEIKRLMHDVPEQNRQIEEAWAENATLRDRLEGNDSNSSLASAQVSRWEKRADELEADNAELKAQVGRYEEMEKRIRDWQGSYMLRTEEQVNLDHCLAPLAPKEDL